MNRAIRTALLCALAFPLMVGLAVADEATEGDAAEMAAATDVTPAEAPAFEQGLRAHVDPATGHLVPPPRGSQQAVDARTRALLNRRSDGLLEVPSAKSGVMVDLMGRFRSATVIDLDSEGDSSAACVTRLETTEGATDTATPAAIDMEGGGHE